MAKLTTGHKVVIVVAAAAAIVGIAYFATRAEAAVGEYCCPYCGECFGTYEELLDHVTTQHPGERIPLPIEWD